MTRTEAPVTPPVVLTIAGSDSGGGAGIQADLKTIEAGGAFGTSAITSVTAQNTRGVESTHVLPVEEIEAQSRAVLSDFDVSALKTGMLATSEVVELTTEQVRTAGVPAVVDPVMVAASGDRLLDREAETAYEELIAEATLVTPNVDEAEVLTGSEVTDARSAREAADSLLDLGVQAALVKGGHLSGEEVVDVLVTQDTVETLRHPRVETDATHGSGCTLSSAIATRLAYGDSLPEAVRSGIDLLARAVRYNLDVGEGPGAVHHTVTARDRAEREPTAESVERVVRRFRTRDVSPLVPAVGMNVAGATPYAEIPDEIVAIDGRISKTLDGIETAGNLRFGASNNVARALLAAREHDESVRFALNCRYDTAVELAISSLDWQLTESDPGEKNDADDQSESQANEDPVTSMHRSIERALQSADGAPDALINRPDVGIEPTTVLFAPDATTLVERTFAVLDALET